MRRLVLHRSQIVGRLTAIEHETRALLQQQGLVLAAGKTTWTHKSIERLRARARPIESCELDELWRGRLHIERTAVQQRSDLTDRVHTPDEKGGRMMND